jgi:hypothetical protein
MAPCSRIEILGRFPVEFPGTVWADATVKRNITLIGLVELINHPVPSEMDLSPGVYFLGMVLDTLSGRNPLRSLMVTVRITDLI